MTTDERIDELEQTVNDLAGKVEALQHIYATGFGGALARVDGLQEELQVLAFRFNKLHEGEEQGG